MGVIPGFHQHDSDVQLARSDAQLVRLSAEYVAAMRAVEEQPRNRDGADKTWVWNALEDVRRHFAAARRL